MKWTWEDPFLFREKLGMHSMAVVLSAPHATGAGGDDLLRMYIAWDIENDAMVQIVLDAYKDMREHEASPRDIQERLLVQGSRWM